MSSSNAHTDPSSSEVGDEQDPVPGPPPRRGLLAFDLLVMLVALIAFVHRVNPDTGVRGALYDAALVQALSSGQEAMNPVFAGELTTSPPTVARFAARLSGWLGLDALHALELVALLSAALFVLALSAVGRRVYRSGAAGRLAVWLAVAGAFAQGPLVYLWRLRSWGAPQGDGSALFQIIHPRVRYMRIWDGYVEAGPLIQEWFTVGARPFAMAMLAMWLWTWRAYLDATLKEVRVVLLQLLFLVSGFGVAAAPVLVGPALVACGPLLVLLHRKKPGEGRGRAALALLVTLLGVGAGVGREFHSIERLAEAFAWHPAHVAWVQGLRMLESGGLLLVLALLGVWSARGLARGWASSLFGAGLILCGLCAWVQLPERGEVELFHAALILWSGSAVAWCVPHEGGRLRRGPLLVCLLAFAAPFGIVVVSHFFGRPATFASEDGKVVLADQTAPEGRLVRWITANTTPGAVFVLPPSARDRVDGRTTAFPLLTRRALFTETLAHPNVAYADDAQLRHWIAQDAIAGRPLGVEGDAYLASLGHEVWIVSEEDEESLARLTEAYGPPAYREAQLVVFRWR